jgi:hypothetical protein
MICLTSVDDILLHAAANSLAVPSLSPKHLARRTIVRADVPLHDADSSSTTAAGLDSTNLVGATVGADIASLVAARGAWQDASSRTFDSGNAQAAVAGTASNVV